jgi:hypothetical protein
MNAYKGLGFTYLGIIFLIRAAYYRFRPNDFWFILGLALCIIGALLIIDTGKKYEAKKKKEREEYENKYKQ